MPENTSEIRQTLDALAARHGLRNLEAELAAMVEDEARPETVAAIRGHLLAQLEGWPDTFRRRLEPWIRSFKADPAGLYDASFALRSFESRRNPAPPAPEGEAAECDCGCRGMNSELAQLLCKIRLRAARLRESQGRTDRLRSLEWVDQAKAELLAFLWGTGQRKVDRLALGQHAVDSAKHELEHLAGTPPAVRGWADSLSARLAAGVYVKGPNKGKPYTERTREGLERELAGFEARYHAAVDRIRALRFMLAENVPALVRDFTGCALRPPVEASERRAYRSTLADMALLGMRR